jgi:Tfp pilus assembly protein PilF
MALPPNYRGIIVGLLALLLALLLLFWLRSKWVTVTAGTGTPPLVRGIPGAGGSAQTSALLIEQGNRAANQGDLAQAYERFNQAIEIDPANAAAWLGKGLVAQQETEKRICFQRVLALDPQNLLAQTELKLLNTRIEGWLNNENHSVS